jgi:hypothetical protein
MTGIMREMQIMNCQKQKDKRIKRDKIGIKRNFSRNEFWK